MTWRAVAIVGLTLISTSALPRSESAQGNTSLVGQLLVAAPELEDPHFNHAVVLMVQDGKDGALGIIINRPVAAYPMAELLRAVGEDADNVSGDVTVYSGGPVEPQIGFIVHSADYHRAGTVDIDGHIAMTASPDILRDIAHGDGPRQSLIAFGYTGWAPGQLANEIAQHAWYIATQDAALVFQTDRSQVWTVAMARRELPL